MRTLTGARCKACETPLPAITDKGGLWGFAHCTECGVFNDVTDAMKNGGKITGEAD